MRLGTVTGKGHAQLIRQHYGLTWTWVSLGTMLFTNLAALVTEFIGVAGAALIFGIPVFPMVAACATLLIGVALSGRYKRAEVFALALCLLELLFIPAAFAAHPNPMSVVRDGLFGSQPLNNRDYLLLVAGNIGAVIMPWMIFYQQSATVDKGLRPQRPHLRARRYGDRCRVHAGHHGGDHHHVRGDAVRSAIRTSPTQRTPRWRWCR